LVPRESPASQWIEGLKEHDYLIPIGEDDLLPDYALDALAIESRRRPDVDVFYTDEDAIDPRGRHGDPRLKPDWSPIFQAAVPYLGAAVAIRAGFASAWPASEFPAFGLAMESRTCRVFHIRRILLTRSRASVAPSVAPALRAPTRESGPSSVDSELRASVIIPTRDRLGLLMRCIASVRKRTVGVNFELIVVDNGSVEPRTRAYLQELARDTNCRVFPCPGPFNYSQLCNEAARAARAPFLVFLNNDVQILNDLWLSRLLSLAAMPDVGAVGAKLLYSNGGIQHAGVVLGIDGRAGHFQRGLSASDLGYFGSLGSPHEVSAVTAACMAIEATKFAAIGGFDEINLPVELNDVDLCLRLNARGWKTLLEARATLTHLESASRGANALLDARYDRQVAYFTERWSQALRDDPYFHPALSLDALQAALG
jgi:GT2 family glycosyltransferase